MVDVPTRQQEYIGEKPIMLILDAGQRKDIPQKGEKGGTDEYLVAY